MNKSDQKAIADLTSKILTESHTSDEFEELLDEYTRVVSDWFSDPYTRGSIEDDRDFINARLELFDFYIDFVSNLRQF